MKKILLASVATVALFSVSAFAADMPTKGPVYKAAPAPVFSWTGCYVGANVGGLWAEKKWFDGPTGTFDGKQDPSGFLGGVQTGCNYQTGTWVFGIQGDYDWTDAKAKHIADPNGTFGAGTGLQSRMSDLASITGRVGNTWDRFLVYVKGGVAWTRDNYTTFSGATGLPVESAKETRTGGTVGIGGEYAFAPGWSAFVEYDHYFFGKHLDTFHIIATGAFSFNERIRQDADVVKVGLNYRFDWGKGPVSAKY
jgi:outer membrane immunogenic protein